MDNRSRCNLIAIDAIDERLNFKGSFHFPLDVSQIS